MSKLNLKYLTKKEDDYYFKINEPEEFLKSQEYVEGTDSYYPFFKSKNSDDYLLKVKSKYLSELDVNKESPFYYGSNAIECISYLAINNKKLVCTNLDTCSY